MLSSCDTYMMFYNWTWTKLTQTIRQQSSLIRTTAQMLTNIWTFLTQLLTLRNREKGHILDIWRYTTIFALGCVFRRGEAARRRGRWRWDRVRGRGGGRCACTIMGSVDRKWRRGTWATTTMRLVFRVGTTRASVNIPKNTTIRTG